ncbi:MAG: hypothetical protein QM737_01220 [Ferruginibacter sp.]
MKKISKIFFKQFVISGNTTNIYLVEETASKTTARNTQKIFSVVDMWNIQRRMRATVIR